MKPTIRVNLAVLGVVLNIVIVAGVYVGVGLQSGAAKLHVISAYRDLQTANVIRIDNESLKKYRGGMFAGADPGDWSIVPGYLSDRESSAGVIAFVVATACTINILVIFMLWQVPRVVKTEECK